MGGQLRPTRGVKIQTDEEAVMKRSGGELRASPPGEQAVRTGRAASLRPLPHRPAQELR